MYLTLALFLFAGALLAYIFFGYAWIIGKLAQRKGAAEIPATDPQALPDFSIVLVTHNGAAHLERRIKNLFEASKGLLLNRIVIVDDGSTDDTGTLLKHFGDPVSIIRVDKHSGKPNGLNIAMDEVSTEIVVLCDVRQSFEKDAIRHLLSVFAQSPKTGAASGCLVVPNKADTVGEGVGSYWDIESRLRRDEAIVDSCIGCTGAIYAIRRDLWEPIPEDTLIDDVVIPLRIAQKGFRIAYVPKAVAVDPLPFSEASEQRRKPRTMAGNFQMLFRYPDFLNPFKHRLAWQIISHKYLRLLSPILLAICLEANFQLLGEVYLARVMFVAQIILYVIGICGLLGSKLPGKLGYPTTFLFLNIAIVKGLILYLKRDRNVWQTEGEK